jgi:hypothetical protein
LGESARWWRRRLGQSLVGNFTEIGAFLRKLISHLDPTPDFGVAESILKPATATPGESPNSYAGLRTGCDLPGLKPSPVTHSK